MPATEEYPAPTKVRFESPGQLIYFGVYIVDRMRIYSNQMQTQGLP